MPGRRQQDPTRWRVRTFDLERIATTNVCGKGGGAPEGESEEEESELLEDESTSMTFGTGCSERSLRSESSGVTGGGSRAIASSSSSSSGARSPGTVGTSVGSEPASCSLSDEIGET